MQLMSRRRPPIWRGIRSMGLSSGRALVFSPLTSRLYPDVSMIFGRVHRADCPQTATHATRPRHADTFRIAATPARRVVIRAILRASARIDTEALKCSYLHFGITSRRCVGAVFPSSLEPCRSRCELQLLRVVAHYPDIRVVEAQRGFGFDFRGQLDLRAGAAL